MTDHFLRDFSPSVLIPCQYLVSNFLLQVGTAEPVKDYQALIKNSDSATFRDGKYDRYCFVFIQRIFSVDYEYV